MPLIQTDIIDLHSLLRSPLEWAMRKLAEARQPDWRGVSWRRDEATLGGILPAPARFARVVLEDGSSKGLSTERPAESDVADAISNLERMHFAASSFTTYRDNTIIRMSAAGHFLHQDALVTFWQHPTDKAARAEIVFRPDISGHVTLEALDHLNKALPGILAVPNLTHLSLTRRVP